MKAFMLALDSLPKGQLEIGEMAVIEEEAKRYYNDSTGEGELGQDETGPWNTGSDWEVVDNPAFEELRRR